MNIGEHMQLQDVITSLHQEFSIPKPKLERIQQLMDSYSCLDDEWQKYVYCDKKEALCSTSSYTRHLVDKGNGSFNLMILMWKKSAGSSIHAHSNSNCVMKVLAGTLKESRYQWPKSQNEPMTMMAVDYLKENHSTYINDEIGLHRIENPSHTDNAISLHLYWPPFDYSKVFEEGTGDQFIAPMKFDTVFNGDQVIVQNPSAAVLYEIN